MPSLKPTHQRPEAFGNRVLEAHLKVGDVSFYGNYLTEVTDRTGRGPQESARPVRGGRTGILERFHRTLLDEHCRVEGRRNWFETIDEMQAVLDDYLAGYNTRRPHQGRGMNERTSIRAFSDGIPKTSNSEVTSQTNTAKLKAA